MAMSPVIFNTLSRRNNSVSPGLSALGKIRGRADACWQPVANLIFPAHCLSCGDALECFSNGTVCLGCAARIEWIGPDRCMCCGGMMGQGIGKVTSCMLCNGRTPVYVDETVCVARYGGPLKSLIKGLKFGSALQAAVVLGQLLAQRIKDAEFWPEHATRAFLVPVPLTRKDYRARGFNQAEEIALVAGAILDLHVVTDVLIKERETAPQATLMREARRDNLKEAFGGRIESVKKNQLDVAILVDDVMTTGATMGVCAKTLKGIGVNLVFAASIARG